MPVDLIKEYEHEPNRRHIIASTPAGYAKIATGGMWESKPHLDLINRHLATMINERSNGSSSNLLIMIAPQHGKTTLVSRAFPGRWLGYFPHDNVILIAYEADFAAKHGRAARDMFSESANSCFNPPLEQDPDISAISNWGVAKHRGSMMTAGSGGSITGNPANLIIIDDPIKNEEQAYSQTQRDSMWDWFTGTVMSRVRKVTSMCLILTPWHEDDISQRIIRASIEGSLEPWNILRIPALSETQEERDDYAERMGLPLGQPDPVGRQPGECLWPEVWPVEKLLMRKKTNAYQFEAMFQGKPRPKGGKIFKGEHFKRCKASDVPRDVDRCRFWDKAATQDGGNYTAGVRMARSTDGRYFIEHVVRERLSAYPRDQLILHTAINDREHCGYVKQRGDQDPGAAGKADGEDFCRLLGAFDVKVASVRGEKVVRARPLASAVEAGNVYLVEAPWNKAFVEELEAFDKGTFDDQVDAASSAYSELAEEDNRLQVIESPLKLYKGRRAREAS